jgi:hypothetical protein
MSQQEIPNPNIIYNNVFAKYTKSYNEKDINLFFSIVDTNIAKRANRKLINTFVISKNEKLDIDLSDSITKIYRISDLYSYKSNDYIIVAYDATKSLKFKNSIETSTVDRIQHKKIVINKIIYPYTNDQFPLGYKDSTQYCNRFGEFILTKRTNSENWKLIDYDKSTIWNYWPDSLTKILFELEEIACVNSLLTDFSPTQIGKAVFKALQSKDYKRIYCQLGVTPERLRYMNYLDFDTLSVEKKVEWFDNFLYKRNTVHEDLIYLLSGYDFSKAKLTNIYPTRLSFKDEFQYSNVLVEFEYKNSLSFIEIECAMFNNSWFIIDDINKDYFLDENEDIVNKRLKEYKNEN